MQQELPITYKAFLPEENWPEMNSASRSNYKFLGNMEETEEEVKKDTSKMQSAKFTMWKTEHGQMTIISTNKQHLKIGWE